MQTGKQELGPTWTRLGATFVDLNAYADCARQSFRAQYEAMGLGGAIMPDGKKNGDYYKQVLANPRLFRQAMDIELPFVVNEVRRVVGQLSGRTGPIVLSWGYLYQLFSLGIEVDHVVLCQTENDIWTRRIQNRAAQIGLANLSGDDVAWMAEILEMEQDAIEAVVAERYENRFSVFNTSADDWGASRLDYLLQSIIRPT